MNAITLQESTAIQPAVQIAAGPMANAIAAIQAGMSLEQMTGIMALQKDWEANEARKSYNVAFAQFKSAGVQIIKNRKVTDGPLKGKSYAELHAVVNAVTAALSASGLSASWKLTKDDRDWIEVTCTLKHAQGHSESVSMGGPPDSGGAKNAIQARASAVSYLERYTLKAITGLSEQDDDGNGVAPAAEVPNELLFAAKDAAMGGWKALTAHIKALSPADRLLLDPESERLKAAAKAADKASQGATA